MSNKSVLLLVLAAIIAGAAAMISLHRDRAPAPELIDINSNPNSPGPAKLESSPTPEQIAQVLRDHRSALLKCIADSLQNEPDAKIGRVTLATILEPTGAVRSVTIDQPLVEASPLGACLRSAVLQFVFPPFSGSPLTIDIPLQVTGSDDSTPDAGSGTGPSSNLGPLQVKKSFTASAPAIRRCVEEELKTHPDSQLTVMLVNAVIDSSGTVTEADVEPKSLEGSPFAECVKAVAMRIAFPQFTGPAIRVKLPIQLRF